MLVLKSLEHTELGIRAVYTVRHNTSEYRTCLEQDLHLLINPETGAIEGKLLVEDLNADSLEEGLAKLGGWCERLAAALREPMKVTSSVPFFAKDWDAINRNEELAKKPLGMTWERLKNKLLEEDIIGDDVKQAALELYDKGFISYPLSDIQLLPAEARADIPHVLPTVEQLLPGTVNQRTPHPESAIFLEAFPYAHHAIVPRARQVSANELSALSTFAQEIYRIVAETYVLNVTVSAEN